MDPVFWKKHPKISKFSKFDYYWFKRVGMVHFYNSLKLESLVWIGGIDVPPLYTKLSYFNDLYECTMPLRLNQ